MARGRARQESGSEQKGSSRDESAPERVNSRNTHPSSRDATSGVLSSGLPTAQSSREGGVQAGDRNLTPSPPDTLCRICLEEDSLENLESPCSCSGTQRHAHHECIQKWVAEKGHLRCEVCHSQYQGKFEVPPPSSRPVNPAPVLQSIVVVDSDGVGRTYLSNGTRILEVLDDDEEDVTNVRQHSSFHWTLILSLFFLFIVMVHPPGIKITRDHSSAYMSDTHSQDAVVVTGSFMMELAICFKILVVVLPIALLFRIAAIMFDQQQHMTVMAHRASVFDVLRHRRIRPTAPSISTGQLLS